MRHPTSEEWVPYIYGETTGVVRRELKAHLHDCAQCRQQLESWQHSLSRLDAWKLPRPHRWSKWALMPLLRWTAATAVILGAGILLGRASAPKVDVEKLRLAIAPEIRREVSAELAEIAREESARAAAVTLASGHRYTDQVAQQLYVAVKKDIDTIAVNADAGLRNTAQQLVQLVEYQTPQTTDSQSP